MTAWLTGITLAAYLLGGLRLICYQRNGARYRRLISLAAAAIIAACLCGAVEILFYRQHPSTDGGAGLGLAVAKGIITAHGGQISAEPASKGSLIRIALPIKKREQ